MKKIILFFSLIILIFSANAQSGVTCTTAIAFPKIAPDAIYNETQKQITQWYQFQTENSEVKIALRNYINLTSDKACKISLWGGSCGTLTLLQSDTLSSPVDSILTISDLAVTSGLVYYIKVDKYTSTDIVTYTIKFNYKLSPPTCGSCSTSVVNTCDMICNGSFETMSCPTCVPLSNSGTVNYMNYACAWDTPSFATPDYFTSLSPTGGGSVHVPNNQFGSETAFHGSNYAGFFAQSSPVFAIPFWHEYVYQQLRCTLDSGVRYNVRFWVSLSDNSGRATNNIGAAFVDNLTVANNGSNDGLLMDSGSGLQTPQVVNTTFVSDTSTWTLIQGSFVANGTEENIVIGDFGSTFMSTGVTGSMGNKAYYYLDSVSVVPVDSIFSLVSDADSTICNGDSVVIQSQVIDSLNVDYYWTSMPMDTSLIGQDSMSIITVFPHDTTIYYSTIFVGSCGCTYHDTIQINVIPLPSVPLIDGDSTACNIGVPIIYTISNFDSTLIYNVNLAVGTGGTVSAVDSIGNFTVTWTAYAGDTILVSVSDSVGCDSTGIFIVKSCCVYGDTTFVNDSASSIIAYYGTGSLLSKSFSINGTLTMDVNMSWANCDVKLGPDAIIDILPTKAILITLASKLSACSNMWNYMKINPGALARIDKNSVIEDAKIAVYSIAGGRYMLNSAILNRNYKDMELTAFAGIHLGTIEDSKFVCQPIIGTIATLNPPYTGYRTSVGIEINGVNSATIGKIPTTAGALTNLFRNMNIGIKATQSSLKVYNNAFKNMNVAVTPNTGIAAITAEGSPTTNRILIVGDGTALGLNSVDNCSNGILISKNMDVNIYHNDFRNIQHAAVKITGGNNGNTVFVRDNDITLTHDGVHCIQNILCNTTISQNRMVNMNTTGIGVWLEELSSSGTGAVYTVFNNTIKKVSFGIRANNLNRATIDNNTIEIKPVTIPVAFIVARGVEVLGNLGTRVTSNVISGVPATTNTKNGGVYASLSPASYISCNNAKDMGYGIQCAGSMASDVFNNIMNNDFYGLVLSNNGFIGIQDNPSVAGQPSYNKWQNIPVSGFPTTSKRTLTAGGTDGSMSKIIFKIGAFPASLNAIYKPYPTAATGAGSIPFVFDSTASGASFGPGCSFMPPALLKHAQDIALENINFPDNDANSKWLSKQGLLVNIKNDSIDVSSDGILTTFVVVSSSDNLGKLRELNSTITNPVKYNTVDMAIAQGISSSISPVNDIETNMKFINDLVINNYLANLQYTSSQIINLRILANKCPFTDGLAVYQARVLLSGIDTTGTFYYNSCEGEESLRSSIFQNADDLEDENKVIMVYPNPARDQLTLAYQLDVTDLGIFEIYNIVGEIVVSQPLSSSDNLQVISLSQLNSGVYFYKYSINNQTINTDKLIIVK